MKALFLPLVLTMLFACGPNPKQGGETTAEAVTGGEHDTITLDTTNTDTGAPVVTPVPMDSSLPEDRD